MYSPVSLHMKAIRSISITPAQESNKSKEVQSLSSIHPVLKLLNPYSFHGRENVITLDL